MPAMRGRRPSRQPPQQHRRRPDTSGVPRLAAIKLDSDWRAPPKITRQGATMFVAATILVAGAAVAGAAWLGGSLFDAREAVSIQADRALTAAGFRAHVAVAGVSDAREAEVIAVAMPEGRTSLLSADPYEIRTRVQSLDWVAHARVKRRWPGDVVIEVERRAAFARWQENGAISVIDSAGERLLAERAVDHPELPLVVGAGASHAAAPLLRALEELPQVRQRLAALVRVGERRWNVELASGVTVALPENEPVVALAQLEALQTEHRLLDRPVAEIDLRVPGQMAVRADAPLLGAGPRGA